MHLNYFNQINLSVLRYFFDRIQFIELQTPKRRNKMATVGELRSTLKELNARWRVNERLLDDQPIPRYRLGAPKQLVTKMLEKAPSIVFKSMFNLQPNGEN